MTAPTMIPQPVVAFDRDSGRWECWHTTRLPRGTARRLQRAVIADRIKQQAIQEAKR